MGGKEKEDKEGWRRPVMDSDGQLRREEATVNKTQNKLPEATRSIKSKRRASNSIACSIHAAAFNRDIICP